MSARLLGVLDIAPWDWAYIGPESAEKIWCEMWRFLLSLSLDGECRAEAALESLASERAVAWGVARCLPPTRSFVGSQIHGYALCARSLANSRRQRWNKAKEIRPVECEMLELWDGCTTASQPVSQQPPPVWCPESDWLTRPDSQNILKPSNWLTCTSRQFFISQFQLAMSSTAF
jgi:hypothetical protein